jgi:hypothetical protein
MANWSYIPIRGPEDLKKFEMELNRRMKHLFENIDATNITTTLNDIDGILSIDKGGTGQNLSDPSDDRILFWDESENKITWLDLGTGLSTSGTTLSATGETSTGKFGDVGGGNYSEFESDGTYKANGNATTFDDLLGDITRLQVVGVGIVADNTENALKFQTSANLSDYAVINYQLRHRWKAGSSIYPHIHFEQTENHVPNFLIRYRWQKNLGAKTTSWSDYKCTTLVTPYTSGTLNNIAHGVAITAPSGYSISDILQFRIFRDNANTSTVFTGADPFTTDVLVTGVDIHIEEDTLGSRSEYSK